MDATKKAGSVCDACITAVYDDGATTSRKTAKYIAMYSGGDLADHVCDVTDGRAKACRCACLRLAKAA